MIKSKTNAQTTKNVREDDSRSQSSNYYRRQKSHGQSSDLLLQDECLSPLLNFKLSFDFDFEFDKTDEMSSLKKKVKTEEEINKCAINEDFTPLQKALFIMKKGYEVQKKCVVSNLEQYVCSDFASNNELLPLILNSIEFWDTEFQCLLAQSLGRTTEKSRPGFPTISSQNLQKAIKLCLDFIDNLNNNDVFQSWSQIFQRLAFELNFIDQDPSHSQQQQFLQETVYAKILIMIDRKQEKRRRLRGSKLFFDLMTTQNSTILTSKEHKKIFMVLQSDTNFFYRADMAESLGMMIVQKEQFLQQIESSDSKSINTNVNMETLPDVITFEQFQSFYLDDFIDLINDSDNLVSLKALQSIAKLLTDSDFIQRELFQQNIKPQLLKMIQTVIDDEENLIFFSQIFGEIIYSFYEKFAEEINDIANEACKFYKFCCNYQKQPQIRRNAAYNFPCIFNIYCMNQNVEIDFEQCLLNLTKIEEESSTKIIIGQQIHELYNICYREQVDVYFLNRAFIQIIKSDIIEVKLSVLNQLSKSVNYMNLYFKNEIVKDLWEFEKFSLKEASVDVETEKYSLQIQETSHGIVSIMHALTENIEHIKSWREIKIFLEQVIQIIDSQKFIQEIQNKKYLKNDSIEQSQQLNYSSLNQQQLIQYFQLNFLCGQLFEITFNILLQGAAPLRNCSLKLVSNFVINIASSVKRQEYVQKIKEHFFFEKTKASWKQIIYLEFCNLIMPFVSLKFLKQQILPDLLKHAQFKRTDLNGGNESKLQNKSKLYFIKYSIQLINEYCAYQDEELALNLMAIIDGFKNIEFNENIESLNEQVSIKIDENSQKTKNKKQADQLDIEESKKQLLKQTLKQKIMVEKQIQEISDAAFWIDDHTSYNLQSNQSEATKKKFQRIELLKLQREKRLGVREQFELENFDSSLIGYDNGDFQALMSIERRQSAGDSFDLFNMNSMHGKNKYKKISGKYTINGLKKQKTTFGITKRFDPEPGSIYSQSQQKVLNNFKKTSTMGINGGPAFPNTTTSTAQMQIYAVGDGNREQNLLQQDLQQNQGHQTSQSLPKKPFKNPNRIGTIGRQLSKSQKKRIDIRTFQQEPQQYKINLQKYNAQMLSPINNSQQNNSDNQIDSSTNLPQTKIEELKIFQQQQFFQDNYHIQKNMIPKGQTKQNSNSFKADKIQK